MERKGKEWNGKERKGKERAGGRAGLQRCASLERRWSWAAFVRMAAVWGGRGEGGRWVGGWVGILHRSSCSRTTGTGRTGGPDSEGKWDDMVGDGES